MENAEAGWSILNQQWQEHRKIRINLLLEMDEQTDKRSQNQPGDKLVLRRSDQGQCFTGRVWRSDVATFLGFLEKSVDLSEKIVEMLITYRKQC